MYFTFLADNKMALKKNIYPIAGFRYEVDIVPEINPSEINPGNVSRIAGKENAPDGSSSFSEISGVTVSFETEDIKDAEGNTHYLPTQRNYTPLTLKRGLTGTKSVLVSWVTETILGEKTQTIVETKSIIVKLLNDRRMPVAYWVFTGAFPTKWTVSGLKAMSNELVIEEMELKYRSFYPVFLA
jgi:phage tail-like protein